MCYPVTCSKCGKTGWGGCGQHVDSVMKSVAVTERCTCDQDSAPEAKSGFLSSLFGR